jgi:rod shape-determining protein MreC
MLINKGSRQNVKEDQGVLSEKGVVGRVWRVFPGQSQVQLVSDNSSGVAVYLSNVNKGGIVAGTGKLEAGILKYIPNTIDVKVGEKVFTSGTDGVFPKDILVGEVVSIKKSNGFFQDIAVKFSADLSHLKYVFVVGGEIK